MTAATPMDVASLLRYTPAADTCRVLLKQWGREHLVQELWDLMRLHDEMHVLPAEALMVGLLQVPGLWDGTSPEQVTLAEWFASACFCEYLPGSFAVELAWRTKHLLDGPLWGRVATMGMGVCLCPSTCDRVHGVGFTTTEDTNLLRGSVKVVVAQPWESNAYLCPTAKTSLLSSLAFRDKLWMQCGTQVLPALWPTLDFVSLHNEVALSLTLHKCLLDATRNRHEIDFMSQVLAAQWLQPRFALVEGHVSPPITLCEQGEPWRQLVQTLFTEVVIRSDRHSAADVNVWGPRIVMGLALTYQGDQCLINLEHAQAAAAKHCGHPASVDWLVALLCQACSVTPCWWNRVLGQCPFLNVDTTLLVALGSLREAVQRGVGRLTTSILEWTGELLDRDPVCLSHAQVQVVLQALPCFLEWWCAPTWSGFAGAKTLDAFLAPDGPVMAFVARALPRAAVDVGVALAITGLGAKVKSMGSAPGAEALLAVCAPAAAAVLAHFERVDWQPLHSVHLSQLWTAMVVSDLRDLGPFLVLACQYARGLWCRHQRLPQKALDDWVRVVHVMCKTAVYVAARASVAWSHVFYGTLLNFEEAHWYGRVRDMLETTEVLSDSDVDALALVLHMRAFLPLCPHHLDPHAGPLTALVVPRGLLHQCSPRVIDTLMMETMNTCGEVALKHAARAVQVAREGRWSPLREAWCIQVIRAACRRRRQGRRPAAEQPRRRRVVQGVP